MVEGGGSLLLLLLLLRAEGNGGDIWRWWPSETVVERISGSVLEGSSDSATGLSWAVVSSSSPAAGAGSLSRARRRSASRSGGGEIRHSRLRFLMKGFATSPGPGLVLPFLFR